VHGQIDERKTPDRLRSYGLFLPGGRPSVDGRTEPEELVDDDRFLLLGVVEFSCSVNTRTGHRGSSDSQRLPRRIESRQWHGSEQPRLGASKPNHLNMNTPLFKNIAFVVYPVKNVKSSRSFYEDLLGLTVTANWEDQWVEYDIGVGTLAITQADESHKAGNHGATIGLEVVDSERVLAHLKAKAVPIVLGPFDSPACCSYIIRDPDQNEIIIHAKK
jgi:catechol 2,3-dioxygenase-like lactoylglutathione lyase family enzyme